MAKNPFYRVMIQDTEQDITDRVVRISYEDTIEQDDLVKISLDKLDLEFIDNTKINKGTKLVFTFGYQGGDISPKRLCVVKDFETNYSTTITMLVKALDQGYLMKKLTSDKVYKGKKSSDVVKEIAGIFGLEYEIQETEITHDALPQGNKSYHVFIQELADREGASSGNKGSFQFYVKGNKLYFTERDLSKESIRTFVYGSGDDIVKSFTPRYEQKSGESEEVSASGIDLDSNESFTEKANVADSEETGVGQNKIVYDVNGKVIKKIENATGKKLVPDSPVQSETKKKVTGKQKDAELTELKGTLSIEGDPLVESGKIITLSGVAQKHAGNWYIETAYHVVSRSGFSTELRLSKNAAIKPPVEDKTKVKYQNKSVGDTESDVKKEVPVIRYDVNGEEIK